MSLKQKLELTWTTDEVPPGKWPRVRLEFAEDPLRAESPLRAHEAILSVCGNPRCGCMNIQFRWLPAPPAAGTDAAPPPLPFLFDLSTRTIAPSPDLPVTPEATRLAEIIRAELTEADQLRLRVWYLARKLYLIESTPGDQVDLSELPDASDGLMVGFVDVFPCGLALNFSLNGVAWAVDEQYCVQPGCDCRETLLSFLKLTDVAGQFNPDFKDPPALYYNYGTGATRLQSLGAPGNPAVEELLAVVKGEYADLNTQLRLRHLVIQDLYLRQAIQRHQASTKALAALNSNPHTAAPHKIGRNEPCPCGSGLKYKRCCLNIPPEYRGNWAA